MHTPSSAQVGRTALTLVYLAALAAAGAPGWAAALLGLVVVAVWAAPLLLWERRGGHRRRPAGAPAVVLAEDGIRTT